MTDCQHEHFEAQVNVNRIEDEGQPRRYAADVTVWCADCRQPFRFLGVRAGLSFEHPTVNVDGTELSAPIEPELVKMLATRLRYDMPPPLPIEP